MKRLIINADDFGFSREVTDGIVHAHAHGCITSTSLMANMPAWEFAVAQAAEHPSLSVGIHLTLTQGKPVLPPERLPSLVGPDGRFLSYDQVARGAWRFRLNREELLAEFAAQIERLLNAGLKVTHIDSHHHITSYPQTAWVLYDLLKRFNIRRIRSHRCRFVLDQQCRHDRDVRRRRRRLQVRDLPKQWYYSICDAFFRAGRGCRMPAQRYGLIRVVSDHVLELEAEDWRTYLRSAPSGISELACHPGRRHAVEEDPPEWREQRVRELEFFTREDTMDALRSAGVRLANYHDV